MKWLWWRRDPTEDEHHLNERREQAEQAKATSARRLREARSRDREIDSLVEPLRNLMEHNNFGAMWTEVFRSVRR